MFSILQIPLHTNEKIPLTGYLVETVHFKPEVAMKSNDFVAPVQANEIGTTKKERQCSMKHNGTTRTVGWKELMYEPSPQNSYLIVWRWICTIKTDEVLVMVSRIEASGL